MGRKRRLMNRRPRHLDSQVECTVHAAIASVKEARCLLQYVDHQLSDDRVRRGFALLELARDTLDHSAWILGITLGERQ